jgi:hypothetical protein
MSDMSTEARALPKPIKGPGLTNAGVIILQFLFILLFETIEYKLGKVGPITGIAIIVAVGGGFYLGRKGTSFATVVNPPIAFFISTILLIMSVGGAGVHVTKFSVDLVRSLGGASLYLAVATIAGWIWHLWIERDSSKPHLWKSWFHRQKEIDSSVFEAIPESEN